MAKYTAFSRSEIIARYGEAPRFQGDAFEGVDLQGTPLAGARFSQASFKGANLSRADLHGALLVDCMLYEVNLRAAAYVLHAQGPSAWATN